MPFILIMLFAVVSSTCHQENGLDKYMAIGNALMRDDVQVYIANQCHSITVCRRGVRSTSNRPSANPFYSSLKAGF
jgi:hypothetical protein